MKPAVCLFFLFLVQCVNIPIVEIPNRARPSTFIGLTSEKISSVTLQTQKIVDTFLSVFAKDTLLALEQAEVLEGLIKEEKLPQGERVAYYYYLLGRFYLWLYRKVPNQLSLRTKFLEGSVFNFQKSYSLEGKSAEIAAMLFTTYRYLAKVGGVMGALKYNSKVAWARNLMIKLNPKNAIVLQQIGVYYRETLAVLGGSISKSILAFQMSLKAAPSYHIAMVDLAECLLLQKERLLSLQYLAQARKISNDSIVFLASLRINGASFDDLQ